MRTGAGPPLKNVMSTYACRTPDPCPVKMMPKSQESGGLPTTEGLYVTSQANGLMSWKSPPFGLSAASEIVSIVKLALPQLLILPLDCAELFTGCEPKSTIALTPMNGF